MSKTIEMQKLSRIHYLKHYVGGEVLVMEPTHFGNGILEEVDLEDNSCLVMQGESSHWIPADKVSAGLKKFIHLNTEELNTLLANILYKTQKLPIEKLHVKQRTAAFVEIQHEENAYSIIITHGWNITIVDNTLGVMAICFPDNSAALIFLLCEMGYDVCGIFD